MYVETVKSVKKGKIYFSYLIRESFRENGKVKHRTISNISKLPAGQILQIKKMLQGNKGSFDINDLENGRAYEYGASYVFFSLAKKLGLDKTIYPQEEQWRRDIITMIVGRIIYQGSKLSLTNMYNDSALWELGRHKFGVRPDVDKHCYFPMDKLSERKNKIETKLVKKHLQNGCIVLYDMTNTWLEGAYKNSELASYGGKPKGGKKGYKIISIGLLTNKDGCPVGVEIFKGTTSDQTTVLNEIKKLSEKYGLKNLIFTGDRGMLTQKRITEVNENGYNTITALTHKKLYSLIKTKNIQADYFKENEYIEINDLDDDNIRYVLCKSNKTMLDERATRFSMINSVTEKLMEKSKVKRKRDRNKVSANVGRIFEKYKIEKFFEWNVNRNGNLSWSLKNDVITAESTLDGCYIIRTDVSRENLDKTQVVETYRNLQKVEQAFKNMKTVLLELRPLYHKTDERIKSHIFIVMLAYYLQWHAMQRLKPLFVSDGKYKNKRWDISIVIERLKSIRKVENLINGIVVKTNISKPDNEQTKILKLLGVKLK
ncbi:MAG: IS1634 family transposase [Candidatus Cloacimonadota bacterium]|nr:IS1634 family transposase [Candidatus Cloacimonadota bacterium]